MAETTRTPTDPADLITDDDMDSVQSMVGQGAGLDIALYEHAPQWRARWVAEALEEIADRAFAVTDAGRRVDAPLRPDRLRALAAEYRNGQR